MATPQSLDDKPAEKDGGHQDTAGFYKESFSRILFVLLVSVVLNFGLACVVLYIAIYPPEAEYFATATNGRTVPLTRLDMPNQSDSAVLQWAQQAAVASFTYNFVNYRSELKNTSNYFTEEGWGQFLQALIKSNSLEIVKQKKLVVSAVVTKAPVILQKGPLAGRFSWRIQMPLLVTYQSASEFQQSNSVVTLLVKRISTLETPRGIGISQYFIGSAQQIVQ